MPVITDIPHSPLPLTGPWPQWFLDDIHLFLLGVGQSGGAAGNVLINGDFEVYQRGPSGALLAPGATGYVSDRWRVQQSAGCDLGAHPGYFGAAYTAHGMPWSPRMRFLCSIAAAPLASFLSQRIEHVNTLAAQQATLSFYSAWQSSAGTPPYLLSASLVQNFGTAGGASAPVTTPLTTFAIPHGDPSGAWTQYSWTFDVPSVAGKSWSNAGIAFDDDYLELQFTLPASGQGQLFFAGIDLRAGPLIPYTPVPFDITLARCQRFYQKSYSYPVLPGTIDLNGARNMRNVAASATVDASWQLKTGMRGVPTLAAYSPNSGTLARIYNATTAADMTVNGFSAQGDSELGLITLSAPTGAGDRLRLHWTADAEL